MYLLKKILLSIFITVNLVFGIALGVLVLRELMYASFWWNNWEFILPSSIFSLSSTSLSLWAFRHLFSQTEKPPVKIQHPPQATLSDKDKELHEIFYLLLERNRGFLTVLNLASTAKISGQEAKSFLEQKAREFNHKLILSEEGEMAYKFEYLNQEEVRRLSKG